MDLESEIAPYKAGKEIALPELKDFQSSIAIKGKYWNGLS